MRCTIYMIGRANATITVNRVTFVWPSIPRSSCGLAESFDGNTPLPQFMQQLWRNISNKNPPLEIYEPNFIGHKEYFKQ